MSLVLFGLINDAGSHFMLLSTTVVDVYILPSAACSDCAALWPGACVATLTTRGPSARSAAFPRPAPTASAGLPGPSAGATLRPAPLAAPRLFLRLPLCPCAA